MKKRTELIVSKLDNNKINYYYWSHSLTREFSSDSPYVCLASIFFYRWYQNSPANLIYKCKYFLIYRKNFKLFPVWLRNRLIWVGLDMVLFQTAKSSIASDCRKFFTNVKIKTLVLIPVLLARAFGPAGVTKLVLIL